MLLYLQFQISQLRVLALPPTLPTNIVEITEQQLSHATNTRPSSFKPKSLRQRASIKRARQEKAVIPVLEPDHCLKDDHNEDVDEIRGEGFDECSWNFVNVDSGNHKGPRLIKTVSYHLFPV